MRSSSPNSKGVATSSSPKKSNSKYSSQKTRRDEDVSIKSADSAQKMHSSIDENDSSSLGQLDQEEDLNVVTSYIDPRTIRWMNKRRPNSVSQANSRISSVRVKQLKAIFKGFQFNEHGKIGIPQFREAINYVEVNSRHASPINENDLFNALDANHDGEIEFPEFIAAMTGDRNLQMAGDSNLSSSQEAFFEFATKHRRQRILDKLSNPDIDDARRYHQFSKLFDVKFFRDDLSQGAPGEDPRHVLQLQQNKLSVKQKKSRNNEVFRSREASLALTTESIKLCNSAAVSRVNYGPPIPERAKTANIAANKVSVIPRTRLEKINKRLSRFSIPGDTFVPVFENVKENLQLRQRVTAEASMLMR